MPTLQENLSQLRDLLYQNNTTKIKEMPNFSFNRDEFIFKLNDGNTKLVSASTSKFIIRVGNIDLIIIKDVDKNDVWIFEKYDNSLLLDGSDEILWLEKLIKSYITLVSQYVLIDEYKSEYDLMMTRISENLI